MSENYPLDFFKAVFRINRHMHKVIVERLQHQMKPVELMTLHFLKHEKICKTSDLAEQLGVPGSTLTGILDRMERWGIVERSRDKADRRVVLVSLRKEYSSMQSQIEASILDYVEKNSSELSAEWWEQMAGELKKLERVMRKREEAERGRE